MNIRMMLPGWTVPPTSDETHIRKYSTTGDILSFKRCQRQYGYFGVRGFASATNTQRYFGTLVHDVLDRVNRRYLMSPDRTLVALPTREEVVRLVEEAHERLVRSGVRPYNARMQQETAINLIDRFVQLIGRVFFQYVKETEYRLERALRTHANKDYILTGVVDVLSGAVSHALGLPFSTMPDDVEIWDYKSGKMPAKRSPELRDYEYQMRVYAELYRQQTGEYPARAVLVFLGELGNEAVWEAAQRDQARSRDLIMRAIYTIQPTDRSVQSAMEDFHRTVEAIEYQRSLPYSDQWGAPPTDKTDQLVDDATCEACELRYNCSHFEFKDPRRATRERVEPL